MKRTKPKPNGYILQETPAAVVIATGFASPSDNRKTGDMLQIWILSPDVHPVDLVKSGADATSICKGCPFASGHGCYVNVEQAPAGIWKAYKRGSYPALPFEEIAGTFHGRKVRFGAYGNPSLIALPLVREIAKASDGWTGYFHDWHLMSARKAKAYGEFLMASTEREEKRVAAQALGLRYFHVSPERPAGVVECLSDAKGISCADCRLCAGNSKRAKSIWISPHGSKSATAGKIALGLNA